MKTIITTTANMALDTVHVYYPESGLTLWGLLDLDSGKLLAVDTTSRHPYHPKGGLNTLNSIIRQGGLRPGHQVAAFEAVKIEGCLYKLAGGLFND